MIPSTTPQALRQKCPVCDAGPGQPCRAGNQTSYTKPRKAVHPERRPPRGMSTQAAAKAMRAAAPGDARIFGGFSNPHGTDSRYSRGCRCDSCRHAHTQYAASRRNATAGMLPAGDPRHGKVAGYNAGCRCDSCRRAASEYSRRLRQRNREAGLIAGGA